MTEKADRPRTTTARTFWKGLALGIPALAVLGFLVGVVGFGLLGLGQAPPPMEDISVSNDGDANHTVRIEVVPVKTAPAEDVPARESSEARKFEAEATFEPGAATTFDGATEEGGQYRLVVTVDDRDPQSFEITGPDDYCQTDVEIASGGAVEVGMGCA